MSPPVADSPPPTPQSHFLRWLRRIQRPSSVYQGRHSPLRKAVYSATRLLESLLADGIQTTVQKVRHRFHAGRFLVQEKFFQGVGRDPDELYERWRKKNLLSGADLEAMRRKSAEFAHHPVISMVIPIYKPDPRFLVSALDSVLNQCYPFWELCLCDDGSRDPATTQTLEYYEKKDSRVRCLHERQNEGIIAASQKAASLARGEFLAFMDQDDFLTPDAFFRMAEKLNEDPSLDLLYSDNDKVDLHENHREVYFKPDFSPDEFFCHNYIGHLTLLRKTIFEAIGGFWPGFEGAQDFEILLRAIEKTGDRIAHVPYVLYSWRKTPGSTASSPQAKGYAYDSGRRALEAYFERKAVSVRVEETDERGLYRVRFPIPGPPKVSLIVPFREGNPEKSLRPFRGLKYPNFEMVLVGSEVASSFRTPSPPVRVANFEGPFMLSRALNAGARAATGEALLFLGEGLRDLHPDWIEALLEPIQRPGVGAVGAKILSPEGRIRSGGIILGLGEGVADAFRNVPENALLYNQPHRLIRNCSALRADCLLTPRSVFEELKGWDEGFAGPLAAVDYCLRLLAAGKWIVWTPFSRVVAEDDLEPLLGRVSDRSRLEERWAAVLSRPDPFYNVNLTRNYTDFSPDVD